MYCLKLNSSKFSLSWLKKEILTKYNDVCFTSDFPTPSQILANLNLLLCNRVTRVWTPALEPFIGNVFIAFLSSSSRKQSSRKLLSNTKLWKMLASDFRLRLGRDWGIVELTGFVNEQIIPDDFEMSNSFVFVWVCVGVGTSYSCTDTSTVKI